MRQYPNVLTEEETLQRALAGASLSRFGDGELRLAVDGSAISQVPTKELRAELKSILRGPCMSLVCLPRLQTGPKAQNWEKYNQEKFWSIFGDQDFGSAFITRPDNAPNIGNTQFMTDIRKLWIGKKVVAVLGTDYGSLREKDLEDTASLDVVYAARRDAYQYISSTEAQIMNVLQPGGVVILCLGATATCLAERLARKGIHALDLGHIGKFMGKYLGQKANATIGEPSSV
jgi:hypothetical protein